MPERKRADRGRQRRGTDQRGFPQDFGTNGKALRILRTNEVVQEPGPRRARGAPGTTWTVLNATAPTSRSPPRFVDAFWHPEALWQALARLGTHFSRSD